MANEQMTDRSFAASGQANNPATAIEIVGKYEGRHLTVGLLDQMVVSAIFEGAETPREANVLNALAARMKGVSFREAAEHAAVYATRDLLENGLLVRPTGVALTCNAGSELVRAECLLRQTYLAWRGEAPADNDWNFEDRGLSATWLGLLREEKLTVARKHLATFLQQRTMLPSTFVISELDKHERINVRFGDDVPVAVKPGLLMEFEHYLRKHTGERLEVFVSEMKDLNRIRRL